MNDKIDRHELFRQLSAPFPEEAIERTRANENGKGYDTTGIRVQFIQNRLNEVLGIGGHRIERRFRTRTRNTRQGSNVFEVTCDLTLFLGDWTDGRFVRFAESKASGGHVAPIEADARKGAQTNAFKKAATAFGIGWRCYAGLQDDDNAPLPKSTTSSPILQAHPAQPATDAQRRAISRLLARLGGTEASLADHVRRKHCIEFDALDRRTASSVITQLQERLDDQPRQLTSQPVQ